MKMKQKLFLALIAISAFLYMYLLGIYNPTDIILISDIQTKQNTKTILFWNLYWIWEDFDMKLGNEGNSLFFYMSFNFDSLFDISYFFNWIKLGFQNCPVFKNCFTYPAKYKDKILYNNNIQIDAIVFHGPEIHKDDIDKWKLQRNDLKKSNKDHDPYFVLFNLVKLLLLCKIQ